MINSCRFIIIFATNDREGERSSRALLLHTGYRLARVQNTHRTTLHDYCQCCIIVKLVSVSSSSTLTPYLSLGYPPRPPSPHTYLFLRHLFKMILVITWENREACCGSKGPWRRIFLKCILCII